MSRTTLCILLKYVAFLLLVELSTGRATSKRDTTFHNFEGRVNTNLAPAVNPLRSKELEAKRQEGPNKTPPMVTNSTNSSSPRQYQHEAVEGLTKLTWISTASPVKFETLELTHGEDSGKTKNSTQQKPLLTRVNTILLPAANPLAGAIAPLDSNSFNAPASTSLFGFPILSARNRRKARSANIGYSGLDDSRYYTEPKQLILFRRALSSGFTQTSWYYINNSPGINMQPPVSFPMQSSGTVQPGPVQPSILPVQPSGPAQSGSSVVYPSGPFQPRPLPVQSPGPVQSGSFPVQASGSVQPGSLPVQPSGPVQSGLLPVQPSGPVQPGSLPVQPPSPVQQGSLPVQPSGPVQPGSLPVQPSGPVQPGSLPVQPSGPVQPGSLPVQPSAPFQPGSLPVQPSGPVQPGSLPEQPSGPAQPGSFPAQNTPTETQSSGASSTTEAGFTGCTGESCD